jgi:hypothetical protein
MTESLSNPLSFSSVTSLLEAILNVVVIISIPIVVLFLILAGFHYVTAQGNPEKIKDASKALLYGVIGGVVILGASAILAIVENTVNAF